MSIRFLKLGILRPTILGVAISAWILATASTAQALVLVVTSDELPQYQEPIEAFEAASSRPVERIDINGSRAQGERLMRAASRRKDIDGVFALGGQAAHLSQQLLGSHPLVFALTLDPAPFLATAANAPIAGVSVEIPPEVLVTRYKLLLPDLRRIGIIRGPEITLRWLAEAEAACSAVGLELVVEEIARSEDAAGAYRRIRTEIDALWMLPDPVVVTYDNFAHLVNRTRADGIAFLAFSENFVRAGALLSIAPTYGTMGSQAAVLLDEAISNRAGGGLQAPLGSKLVINADTARAIHVNLDGGALSVADLVVRDREQPRAAVPGSGDPATHP